MREYDNCNVFKRHERRLFLFNRQRKVLAAKLGRFADDDAAPSHLLVLHAAGLPKNVHVDDR